MFLKAERFKKYGRASSGKVFPDNISDFRRCLRDLSTIVVQNVGMYWDLCSSVCNFEATCRIQRHRSGNGRGSRYVKICVARVRLEAQQLIAVEAAAAGLGDRRGWSAESLPAGTNERAGRSDDGLFGLKLSRMFRCIFQATHAGAGEGSHGYTPGFG